MKLGQKFISALIIGIFLMLFMGSNVYSQSSEKKILFIGDSITQGAFTVDANGNQLTGLTTERKFSYLIGNAKGYTTIINKGKSGDTVIGLRNRLQADVISQMPLDMVVIMIGRNDVANSANPVTPVSTYKSTLNEIVQTLKNSGVQKILLLTWNVGNHQFYAGVNSPAFLDATAQVAAENNVYYIDVYSMWASYKWASAPTVAAYDALYYDNIHPNAAGHLAIANFVLSSQFNSYFDDVTNYPSPTQIATLSPTFTQTPTASLIPTQTETQYDGTPTPIDLPAACGAALEELMRSQH